MEQVLFNESRVAPRLTLLKPLSAAVAIGTGGPFGAEGPIIATGGALGSLLGQVVSVTAHERKALLAAGAAAGMAATFGTPVSAVILAVELLLFEYRRTSLIPVALASATAAACRGAAIGFAPVFEMPHLGVIAPLSLPSTWSSARPWASSRSGSREPFTAVEDLFERLPVHWMWWPAVGGLVVGAWATSLPTRLASGTTTSSTSFRRDVGRALLVLCVAKFASWSIALGSGTSGGTLAPLFTIGGVSAHSSAPSRPRPFPARIDPRMAAVVGMAALFAGRLARDARFGRLRVRDDAGTGQARCPSWAAARRTYLVSCLLMRTSIMTEKIADAASASVASTP